MNEEEYFRKNYPDSCYGDKPLSPHWDFFQDGVEFGERQSEKKIADLEKENTELRGALELYEGGACRAENHNKCKLVQQLEEENAQWEQRNETLKDALEHARKMYGDELEKSYKENAEQKKELKKWKDEWQEQVQKATDEGYARTLQTMQLTTAIEIIKDLLSLCEGETDSKLVFTRAEQFLKEVEE